MIKYLLARLVVSVSFRREQIVRSYGTAVGEKDMLLSVYYSDERVSRINVLSEAVRTVRRLAPNSPEERRITIRHGAQVAVAEIQGAGPTGFSCFR